MKSPKDDAVASLVEFKKGELGSDAAFDVLSNVRSENLWLANFSSQNTRDAYQRSVATFIATLGIYYCHMRTVGDLDQERNIKLIGADALSTNGFTQVPNYALKSPRISPGAKLAYAILLSYAWDNDYCFPGQETLAKDMGCGLRSIARYVKELEKEKFLSIKKLGQGRVNLYELNLTVPKGGRTGRS